MPSNSDYDDFLANETLDSDTDGDGIADRRSYDKEFIAVPPGLPGGYKAEEVEICDPATGVATTRTFLTKSGAGTTSSCPTGGGGSTYDPCCEPMYTSLGFRFDNGLYAEGVDSHVVWPCLRWDGSAYRGINTYEDSMGDLSMGSYNLEVYFDECGRGWTGVIEPLNTKSIMGTLSLGDNMSDTKCIGGSYMFTGGGSQLWDDLAQGVSLSVDRKAFDYMDCGSDLVSEFGSGGTPLRSKTPTASGFSLLAEAPVCVPEEPDVCECEYAEDFTSPVRLKLYPDSGDTTTYIDLGRFIFDVANTPQCRFISDPNDPNAGGYTTYGGTTFDPTEIFLGYNEGITYNHWEIQDHSMHDANLGSGTPYMVMGLLNLMNYENGGFGTWNNSTSTPEVYSAFTGCADEDLTDGTFIFYGIDSGGGMVYIDPYNGGGSGMTVNPSIEIDPNP